MGEKSTKIQIPDKYLKCLNISIDRVIKEKKQLDIDYEVILEAMTEILENRTYFNQNKQFVVTQIKREEMLKIILDFFKSIDQEFYDKAVNIILQQNKDIKINMYNCHENLDYKKVDENDIHLYTKDGSVEYYRGKAIVHVPLNRELDHDELDAIGGKDMCTLDDAYTVVHEIAHLFDDLIEDTKINREEIVAKDIKYADHKINKCRQIFSESTAIAFEGLFSEYLSKHTNYSEAVPYQNTNKRTSCLDYYEEMTYMKLLLAKEKGKDGIITNETIQTLMENMGVSKEYTIEIIKDILADPRSVQEEKKYAISSLISPMIIKRYNENPDSGAQIIKEYLEAVKHDNIQGVFDTLEIKYSKEGLKELVDNKNEREMKIEKEKELEGR